MTSAAVPSDVATRAKRSARFTFATDAELVRAAMIGDRDAIAAIWHRYAPACRRFLQRKLGFGDNVEDLLQDVFLSFFVSVQRIRNQDSLRAFLLAITANLAGHHIRLKGARQLVSLSEFGEMPDVALPPSDFEGRESLLTVQRALARMPHRVQFSYCLFHLSGLGLGEVARAVGVSCSTAKRDISRARKRLLLLNPRHEISVANEPASSATVPRRFAIAAKLPIGSG
jgi:RNA polymerase sigma-70 factor, ECF subfamily